MAWNRPSANGPTIQKKRGLSPVVKGLLGGGIVAVVLGAAFYFLFSGDDAPAPSTKHQASRTIKEATPAPAPKPVPEEEPAAKPKPEKPKPKSYRNLSPEEREKQYEKDLAETPIPANTNRTFRTGLEQLISWVFTVEPGDPPPPPLPMVSDFDLVHFEEILNLKNEAKKDDDEATVATKETVDYVKGELKKYVEKGGDPQEFLQYYRDQLDNAYQKRKMMQDQVVEIIKGDPSLAADYLKEVNARLAEEGIKPVVIPDRLLKRLGVKIDLHQQPSQPQPQSQQ